MSLAVIGAGLGRTGTMSLKAALEELGFGPCYHMTEVFENPDHVELWEAAARGEPIENWEEVFRGYRAAVDWPAAAFYEELMERYPGARVILTVRDADRWYESARGTIYGIRDLAASPAFTAASWFVPRMRRLRRAALMAGDLVWDGVFDGRFEDRRYAIAVYDRWNEEVRRRVPPERLLAYEVKEGWGPLCGFLGVEAPDGPFPHLNDAVSFRRTVRRRSLLVAAAALALPTVLALVYLFVRKRPGSTG